MKPQLPSIVALLVALLTSGVASATDAPKGFRGLMWGSSSTSGLKKLSGPTSDGTSLYVPVKGKQPAPLLEVAVAAEAYSFTHGKFYSGSAWLDGRENFDRMKVALSKQFGQPSFANEGRDTYKWKWPGTKIEVSLYYQAKFSRTTVTYSNDSI